MTPCFLRGGCLTPGPPLGFPSRVAGSEELPLTPDGIAGIILAAGTSSRMGRNKLLLNVGGRSLVRRATETALAARLDPVVVVLGHESDLVKREVADLPCLVVVNSAYAAGLHTSLRAGVDALPETCVASMVLLADMPLVAPDMLRTLRTRYLDERPPLVVSDYGGVSAPPILYDRRIFDELRVLEDERGGKGLVGRYIAEALRVRWPSRRLTDLDRPEDIERVRLELESASGH